MEIKIIFFYSIFSGRRNGDIQSKTRGKNPFLSEDEDEVKSAKDEDNALEEISAAQGLEALTSAACFACDAATQTPLPAKPCCTIM